jgi:hypothetical protein
MASQPSKLVAVEDAAADLGLTEADVLEMLKNEVTRYRRDYRGRLAIEEPLITRIASSDEYASARARVLAQEIALRRRTIPQSSSLREKRERLLDEYDAYISTIEHLHRKYLIAANNAGSESPGMAVYLLLSRAISVLRMACHCLRGGYWYCGSMLREIDECLDVATFFWITATTPEGFSAQQKWFRQNHAPTHAACRKVISQSRASIDGAESDDFHLNLLGELYRKKSKWIHPTFLAICEVAEYELADPPLLCAVDYGPCTYEYKLWELTDFFRSSIWTTYQTLWLSFHHVFTLAPGDVAILREHDLLFQRLSRGDA